MKNIKSLLVALVLVAVTVTGFNSVAGAASVYGRITSTQWSCGINKGGYRTTINWTFRQTAGVSKYFKVSNANAGTVQTTSNSAVFQGNYAGQKFTIKAWVDGNLADTATVNVGICR